MPQFRRPKQTMSLKLMLGAALAVFLPALSAACAQTSAPAVEGVSVIAPVPSVTEPEARASGVFGGQEISYTARLETLSIQSGVEGRGADISTFSYVADGDPSSDRPVLFAFNGGPIAASIWLHMGALGPYRVHVPDDLSAPASEAGLVPNDYSPLDVADIVFFDPATTGFSTVHDGVDPQVYYTVEDDAGQLADFIEAWLVRHDRVGSPIFLLGESYGTMRAAVTAGQLAERDEAFNADGVFLMGQAVNMVEYSQRRENIISYVVSLPTLAATAWEHGKADAQGRDFETFLADAWAFAETDYLLALFQGNGVDPELRAELARKLEAYTGISADYYVEHNLRITKETYRRELFREEGLILGRSDARYVGEVPETGYAPDPSGVLQGIYVDGFTDYVADTFGVTIDESYVQIANTGGWYYGAPSPFTHFAYGTQMDAAFEVNPDFRLFIGTGYQDTMTTLGAADYAVMQSEWPLDRVRTNAYWGGHMAYSVDESAAQFGADVRDWIKGWSAEGE